MVAHAKSAQLADLLVHADWLRALAAHLVRGGDGAEDVAQETWLAALRAGPDRARPARPWLATVARNFAIRRARASHVRRRNEGSAAAEGPIVPSPEALLIRARAQRTLAELVAGLAEPYRSTVLLRYYEGLTAAAIARAQKVPPGTVRWRLKEALARLRAGLDARSGGRHQWALALSTAPFSRALVPSWKGGLLLTATTKANLLIGIVAAALLGGAAASTLAPPRLAATPPPRAASPKTPAPAPPRPVVARVVGSAERPARVPRFTAFPTVQPKASLGRFIPKAFNAMMADRRTMLPPVLFAAERREPRWAGAMERVLRDRFEGLGDDLNLPGLRMGELECRESTCRVDFHYRQADQETAMNQGMDDPLDWARRSGPFASFYYYVKNPAAPPNREDRTFILPDGSLKKTLILIFTDEDIDPGRYLQFVKEQGERNRRRFGW